MSKLIKNSFEENETKFNQNELIKGLRKEVNSLKEILKIQKLEKMSNKKLKNDLEDLSKKTKILETVKEDLYNQNLFLIEENKKLKIKLEQSQQSQHNSPKNMLSQKDFFNSPVSTVKDLNFAEIRCQTQTNTVDNLDFDLYVSQNYSKPELEIKTEKLSKNDR